MATTNQRKLTRLTSSEDVRAERIKNDPEFREYWERTAFSRALSIEVLKRRTELRLTIEELADMLDVDPEVVGILEDGEKDPSLEILKLLSEKLGIEFDVAVTLKRPMSPDAKVSVLRVELGRHADVA